MNNLKTFIKNNYKKILASVILLLIWNTLGNYFFSIENIFYFHHFLIFTCLPIHVILIYAVSIYFEKNNRSDTLSNIIYGVAFPVHIWFTAALFILLTYLGIIPRALCENMIEGALVFTLSLSGIIYILIKNKIFKRPNWINNTYRYLIASIFTTINLIFLWFISTGRPPINSSLSLLYNFCGLFCEMLFYKMSFKDFYLGPDTYNSELIKNLNFDYSIVALLQLSFFTYMLWFKKSKLVIAFVVLIAIALSFFI